jgi:CBS domain-containing protein
MRVRHVMTKNPSCCVPSDPAPRAAGIMRNEDTGIIPVIENEQSQKIVGVVTDATSA